jgi:hypothetical protein
LELQQHNKVGTNVLVAGSGVGSVPHQIDLKVTQLPGGQLSEVSGFAVSPEDVIQVKQGENLIVSTSPDLRTHQVTVRNIQGISIDLVLLSSNVWSLQGLLPGVYTLDIAVDMSSSGILGTYETMLVILEPNQQPLPPTNIISQITIEESQDCPGNSTPANGNCVEPLPPSPPPLPPCDENIPPGESCEPIPSPPDCDVDNPPPECEEPPICTEPECAPTECPDGQIVPPGEDCPEEPPEEEPPEDEEGEDEDSQFG